MSFWDFSLKIYQPVAVREACLRLQNDHGLDVNMVLFCCWYANKYGNLNNDLFMHCHEFSRTWSDQVVKPIRSVRTSLKESGCTALPVDESACMKYREHVKQIELEAEKLQQMSLEGLCLSNVSEFSDTYDKSVAISENLKTYLGVKHLDINTELVSALEILAKESIPDLDILIFKKVLFGS